MKILAIILLGLFGFGGFGFLKSGSLKDLHITKEVNINADAKTVFDNVKYLENFPKWSPFLEEDPDQIYEVKGTDGMVGAQYHWNGNKGKDLGYQEIKEIREGEYIKMGCDIQKPFKATPTFEYTFTENNGTVTVRQDFKLQSGAVDAFFMWLFGAKKGMETTNERGLELLKKASEQ